MNEHNDPIAPKNRARRRLWLLGLIAITLMAVWFSRTTLSRQRAQQAVLVLGTGTNRVTVTADTLRERVRSLVAGLQPNNNFGRSATNVQALIELGLTAVPYYREILDDRPTRMTRVYQDKWGRLPKTARRILPEANDPNELRGRLIASAWELGPVLCRSMSGALADNLLDREPLVPGKTLRALLWSLPESPKAVATLDHWLANANQNELFGWRGSEAVWPQLPPAVSRRLVDWLKKPDVVSEAARALAELGTNGTFAIPALIEVLDNGVAGPSPNYRLKVGYDAAMEPFSWSRSAAAHALGRIGVASSNVIAALDRGMAFTNQQVGAECLFALAELKQDLGTRLRQFLADVKCQNGWQVAEMISRLGRQGAAARPALDWIGQFTSEAFVEALPEVDRATGDLPTQPHQMVSHAVVAVCRIAPEETGKWLPYLVNHIGNLGGQWSAVEFLAECKTHTGQIAELVEPHLRDESDNRARAAFILLGNDPAHTEARATLLNAMAEGTLRDRSFAAAWLWERTRDASLVLPTFIECLAATDSTAGQIAASTLENMDAAARPAVLALKEALWHKDRWIRQKAGTALRKIAPEEMPPIVE